MFSGFAEGVEVVAAEVMEGIEVEDGVVSVSGEVESVVIIDSEGGVRFVSNEVRSEDALTWGAEW